jgi:hypothetical protein
MRVDLKSLQAIGGAIDGVAHVGSQKICSVDLTFAYLNTERFQNQQMFSPSDFCRLIRLLRLADVGRYEDGRPIELPAHLLAAEQASGAAV